MANQVEILTNWIAFTLMDYQNTYLLIHYFTYLLPTFYDLILNVLNIQMDTRRIDHIEGNDNIEWNDTDK